MFLTSNKFLDIISRKRARFLIIIIVIAVDQLFGLMYRPYISAQVRISVLLLEYVALEENEFQA